MTTPSAGRATDPRPAEVAPGEIPPVPPAPPEPPPPPPLEPGGVKARLRAVMAWMRSIRPDWVDRISLRSRLVILLCALLAAGLGIAGLATTTVVSRYLVGQVDTQLRNQAAPLANETAQSTGLPSDYYIQYDRANGSTFVVANDETIARYGIPEIPDMTAAQIKASHSKTFTVDAKTESGKKAKSSWRVIPLTPSAPRPDGITTAYVAYPLANIHDTVKFLRVTLGLSALGIVILGGVVAFVAVRRALRPLREIETTAAAIAAGDLSRRIPPAAPTTEVGSLAASLNAMLAQIEQAFATRERSEARMREFVSDASHELRTPVATIRGYGELYRMGALDTRDKVDDTMCRIEDAARRMGTLVNDLLALARLDEGRPLKAEPVDLVALARDSAQDLHALDPARTVRVIGLADSDPGNNEPTGNEGPDSGAYPDPPKQLLVTGDEERLRQVFANLIGNVARYTPAGSNVEIAVGTHAAVGDNAGSGANGMDAESAVSRDKSAGRSAPSADEALVEIRDHGPGVESIHANRIFERFYRADSSRNRTSGGSGLGLAIVAAIIGAHHGHVSVRTTDGGGLTVCVGLPRNN